MVPDLGEVALTRPYSGPTPNQVQKAGAGNLKSEQRTSSPTKAPPTLKNKCEIVDLEKEQLQLKWEKLLGPKFTIVVSLINVFNLRYRTSIFLIALWNYSGNYQKQR